MVGFQRHPAGCCRERRRTAVSEIRTKQTVTVGDTSYTRSFPQILNTKAAKAPVRTRLGMHAPGPPSSLSHLPRRRPYRSHNTVTPDRLLRTDIRRAAVTEPARGVEPLTFRFES